MKGANGESEGVSVARGVCSTHCDIDLLFSYIPTFGVGFGMRYYLLSSIVVNKDSFAVLFKTTLFYVLKLFSSSVLKTNLFSSSSFKFFLLSFMFNSLQSLISICFGLLSL